MAESRRVQLTTLPCDDAPSSPHRSPAARARPPGGPRDGDAAPDGTGGAGAATVRLQLTLFEPDERSFPEFSYGQLVDNQMNHTKEEVPLSRFEKEDKRANDEVAAMTRKLEEKYGGKPKKKKKEDRIQDLIDIGFGYDDEDSFIDNSEAYDEFVPASISTKFGGFYVNSGVLQFRQSSETEDLATEEETLEPSKKRKVSDGRDQPKKKRCSEGGERRSNVDLKSSTLPELGHEEEMTKRKKKKPVGTLSVTSMLKKFQREKEKERQKMEKANQMSAAVAMTTPLCPADAGGGGGSGLTDPLLSLIGSTNDHALIQAANAVDFDIDLDSLLDVTEETSSPKGAPQPQPVRPKTGDLTRSDPAPQVHPPNPAETPHSEQIQLPSQTSSVPLPEGLPPRLEDSIRKLMAVAKTLGAESKLKFFTPEINSILLDIELQCREQGAQSRSRVYTHLSAFLPCSRDTLLKRVKKLLLAHADGPPDVDEAMQKLQEAISRAMPEQVACFYETCQIYEQVKTSKAAEEEKDGPEDNVEEKGGKRGGGGPKKLFKWNEEIRESLRQVLRVKMERYQKEGNGSQEMEQHLKTLLDTEVQPLWPKGWMQSRVLRRESRKMLSLFTSSPVQRVRPEKKQPTIGVSPAASDSGSVLRGLPLVADDVIIRSSRTSSSTSVGGDKREATAHQKAEGKPGEATVDDEDKPRVNATSTPTHSLLDLLADQALAKEQPLPVSLLAAAVARYRCSAQRWSFGEDAKSPLLPPPPPQSSPVGFPLRGGCHMVLPQLQLLQVGDLARRLDPGHVQVISDDEDIAIQ